MTVRPDPAPRPTTLVWIDAEEAVVLRWQAGAEVRRHRSDVPSRHRSTGHVRHDPRFRAGGGSVADDGVERRRRLLLDRFLGEVAELVPPDDRAVVIGPGTVREQLAEALRVGDRRHGRLRPVDTEPAGALTEPQLVAMLRRLAGVPPVRRLPASAVS
jgi:hypothetical protein